MPKVTYITQKGLEKLKRNLDQLIRIERPAISKLISDARDKGDLAENAEYVAAKEAQEMLEMRIAKLENMIANSRIIDESQIDTSRVRLLNKIKIRNTLNNEVKDYIIVPETEADLKAGKISVNTPIAQGLLGKKIGETVNVKVPSGQIAFEIINISL